MKDGELEELWRETDHRRRMWDVGSELNAGEKEVGVFLLLFISSRVFVMVGLMMKLCLYFYLMIIG